MTEQDIFKYCSKVLLQAPNATCSNLLEQIPKKAVEIGIQNFFKYLESVAKTLSNDKQISIEQMQVVIETARKTQLENIDLYLLLDNFLLRYKQVGNV